MEEFKVQPNPGGEQGTLPRLSPLQQNVTGDHNRSLPAIDRQRSILPLLSELRVPFAIGLLLCAAVGSISYWRGWLVVGIVMARVILTRLMLGKHEFDRMSGLRNKRNDATNRQNVLSAIGAVLWVLAIAVLGLDVRSHWSNMPITATIFGSFVFSAGQMVFAQAIRVNNFATRVVMVLDGQEVIKKGPYRLIRHPMYLGLTVSLVAAPLILGSWYMYGPVLAILGPLYGRTLLEEKTLLGNLKGYREYMNEVRYRIVPYLW